METQDRLCINGREFTVERLDADGRNAIAYIHTDRIVIKIPRRLSRRDSEEAYMTLKERVIKMVSRWGDEKFQMISRQRHIAFYDKQELNLMGNRFRIDIREEERRRAMVRSSCDNIVISLPNGLRDEKKMSLVSYLARKAISRRMLPLVKERLLMLNGRHFGYKVGRMSIKDQATRWGSCSRNNNINLNFRLLFAPQEIMDYVIMHELAHIGEPNHSPEFWNLIATAVPDYKEKIKWLRKEGKLLGKFTDPNKIKA